MSAPAVQGCRAVNKGAVNIPNHSHFLPTNTTVKPNVANFSRKPADSDENVRK
jgi:hypothetical protein